jgi:hypothetical protein
LVSEKQIRGCSGSLGHLLVGGSGAELSYAIGGSAGKISRPAERECA